MTRQLKILFAKASLNSEDAGRHHAMITYLESDGDKVTVKGASGTYPIQRAPELADLDRPSVLVEDPANHPSTDELRRKKRAEEELLMDCLVVDMAFNSSQLGYMVGQASLRGQLVLALREKSTAYQLPRLDQFEEDENVTICEYRTTQELEKGIQAFKSTVRHRLTRTA